MDDYLTTIIFVILGAFIGNKLYGEDCNILSLLIVIGIYAIIIGIIYLAINYLR